MMMMMMMARYVFLCFENRLKLGNARENYLYLKMLFLCCEWCNLH